LAALPNGQQLISQYGVSQIRAEYSRTYDGGVDQGFFNGQARLGLTYFHNEFTNGIEYIPQQGLLDLGVPAAVVDLATFGATVNSQAFRAQGVETEIEYDLGHGWFARGGYTYLDAVVQRSFSSDAIGPSFNPNFPTMPIGIDTPLIGARPFRRAPHTGYFGLGYNHSRFSALLTGTLVGRRDDSDFISSDANGGNSLLLPNRNLDGAYQKLDFSGGYQVSHLLNVYSSFQNLLSEQTSEAFGYPVLPFTFRSGINFTFGGESWKLW
jgi:iron complex outermembrane receptor protein/vitamin B12 transporter